MSNETKSEETDKPIEVKKSKPRMSKAHIDRMIEEDIIPAIRNNKTLPEINRLIQAKHGRSRSQATVYIKRATDQLKIHHGREVEVRRVEMLESLHEDMAEAHSNYKSATYRGKTGSVWFRIYMDIKETIRSMSANSLKEEEADKSLNINIKYEDA